MSLAPTSRILSNEIKVISKLVEGEGEGNICTNKILGSLEILAIKKMQEKKAQFMKKLWLIQNSNYLLLEIALL